MNARTIILPKLRRDFLAAKKRGHFPSASADEIARQQLEAFQSIWADAVTDIPYYADVVKEGHAPRDMRCWDEFQEIPVLTRQILQESPDAFIRHSGPPDDFIKTAGSTGTPLRLGMNQAERDLMRLVKLAAWQHFGYDETSRLFLIWGHSHLLGTGWRGRINHAKRKIADRLLGYQRVDAYRLNRSSCRQYAEQMLRFKPLGLVGYASALDLFARHTADLRDRFRSLGMRFVLATSEPPPRADTVEVLEELFGCPVVQEYGGAEFGQVAFKEGAGPFEVYSDLNYVECRDSALCAADGQAVWVTSLYPRYVPLIRYGVGDAVGDPEVMEHGHVVRFGSVAGRINDVIHLDDGDAIHSVAIFHCIHQEPSVLNIQMLLSDSGIEIRLICAKQNDAGMESRIRTRLTQVHPFLSKARIVYSDDLVTNRAGKRRWFLDERTTGNNGEGHS